MTWTEGATPSRDTKPDPTGPRFSRVTPLGVKPTINVCLLNHYEAMLHNMQSPLGVARTVSRHWHR